MVSNLDARDETMQNNCTVLLYKTCNGAHLWEMGFIPNSKKPKNLFLIQLFKNPLSRFIVKI